MAHRPKTRPRRRAGAVLLVGLALIALTRTPYLHGPNVLLDGDEATLGLMARHLLRGVEVPVFFWGQDYGLVLPEAASGALMLGLFGHSDVSLRLGMLAIWTLGWVFAALTLREMGGRPVFALLLACCPAWSLWSMAARGGYVTAFMLTQLGLWLAARLWRDSGGARAPLLGIAALGLVQGLLLHAQPLWLLVLIPFDLRLLLRDRPLPRLLAFAAGGAIGALPLRVFAPIGGAVVHRPSMFGSFDPMSALAALPGKLSTMFGGLFFFGRGAELGPLGTFSTLLWCLALLGCLGHAVVSVVRRQPADLARTCSLGILMPLLLAVLADPEEFHPRYLLPVAGILGLYLGGQLTVLWRRGRRPWLAAVLPACLLGGSGALAMVLVSERSRFEAYAIDARELEAGLEKVLETAEREGIRHLYCCQMLLQWQVMFYSEERVLTRGLSKRDRYPPFLEAVDAARQAGQRCAILGWCADTRSIQAMIRSTTFEPKVVVCGKQLFMILDPDERLLAWHGFELH